MDRDDRRNGTVTRTQRILAVLHDELSRHQESIDADDLLAKLTIVVKLNDGGYPRAVWIDRESMSDLTKAVRK